MTARIKDAIADTIESALTLGVGIFMGWCAFHPTKPCPEVVTVAAPDPPMFLDTRQHPECDKLAVFTAADGLVEATDENRVERRKALVRELEKCR